MVAFVRKMLEEVKAFGSETLRLIVGSPSNGANGRDGWLLLVDRAHSADGTELNRMKLLGVGVPTVTLE